MKEDKNGQRDENNLSTKKTGILIMLLIISLSINVFFANAGIDNMTEFELINRTVAMSRDDRMTAERTGITGWTTKPIRCDEKYCTIESEIHKETFLRKDMTFRQIEIYRDNAELQAFQNIIRDQLNSENNTLENNITIISGGYRRIV